MMQKDICSFDEALKKAKARNSEYNTVQEYKDSYYFFVNDGEFKVGGAGIVILKKDGKMLLPVQYFMNPKSEAIKVGEERKI